MFIKKRFIAYDDWADCLTKTELFSHVSIVLFMTNKISFMSKYGQEKYNNMSKLLK